MADIKINDLTAYTDPVSTDVLAIVDVGNDLTKKVSIADLLENAGTGSAAAPSFSFDGDSDTGIYRPAADQVALTAGGTQALLAESTGITIPGNLTVSGTTTTIDTTTLVVEDKNIEMGAVTTPTDVTADGGGITLKGATDKTINWVNSTDAWTLSEHVNIASAKEFRIAGTKVLDATSLGSAVVGSSLTSVGTIGTGVWNGTAIATAYIADSAVTSAKIADGTIVNADINASAAITGSKITTGTTSDVGVLQLTDSTSSTSTTTAATPNAVKTSFDLAGAALPKSGGTLTGDLTIPDKIIHSGDTNTAIRFPAADTFAVETAGTERLRIDSSGVGIGTTSPSQLLEIKGDNAQLVVNGTTTTDSGIEFQNNGTSSSEIKLNSSAGILDISETQTNGVVSFSTGTGGTERMRIDSSGVGIGTTSPSELLEIKGSNAQFIINGTTTSDAGIEIQNNGTKFAEIKLDTSNSILDISQTQSSGKVTFSTGSSGTERMRISENGNVFIGGTTASSADIALNADGSASFAGALNVGNTFDTGNGVQAFAGGSLYIRQDGSGSGNNLFTILNGGSSATNQVARINGDGSATFAGAVSKGSGSFRISHPLPAKTETHHLVHSFIEGPQADLIYRGYADLVDGEATVNIDTAARMTEGTFEVLCTNISCFTSNESDWTAVKGSVTGNVLTITAQNATATSKVSWMVVGERKDQHMLDTDWTDNAGRVITEPLKVVDE
tara:strand:+ start:5714 stop:7900 length:2187 start_codon:yes stop_codon:yes gene_type:complete